MGLEREGLMSELQRLKQVIIEIDKDKRYLIEKNTELRQQLSKNIEWCPDKPSSTRVSSSLNNLMLPNIYFLI